MKKIINILSIAGVLCGGTTTTHAQLYGSSAFLKGDFVEVGINANGGFGTDTAAPVGYHPNVTSAPGALGFVADPEKDGWLVSVPPSPRYMGDYFVPGDPYEGWGIQAGSMAIGYGRGRDGSSGITSYGNRSYSATATQTSSVWTGMYGALSIKQTTTQKKDKLYFVMNIEIVNTGATSIPGVYYFRGLDPDNEQPWSGNFATHNEVVYQPNAVSKNCLVTATGDVWPYMSYLGLGTKDCRAQCMIMSPWLPSSLAETYTGLGSGSVYKRIVGDKIYADHALGMVWNLGTLAPGQTTNLAYAYILKREDLDSALEETAPKFLSDGIAYKPYSTFRVCPGKSISMKITNGGQYKWIWTPSTYMNSLPGTTIVGPGGTLPTVTGTYAYPDGASFGDSISVNVYGPQEYRATGISNCDTQVLIFYVDTISFAIPPSVSTPLRYCEGETTKRLSAGSAPGATLRWYTQAVGGTYTTAAPTPATDFKAGVTADYDTNSYYVSQVNAAGCETPRAEIQVILTRKPGLPLVDSLIYCKGATPASLSATGIDLKWYDAATGGTRYTLTPTPSANTTGTTSYFVSQTINGCESDRAQLKVEISGITAAFDVLRDSLCNTEAALFTNRSTNAAVASPAFTSSWNFGDGNTDTARHPSHAYAGGTAVYTVQLVVTNINGCTDSVIRRIYTFPQPAISATVSDSVICQGESVDFKGTAAAGHYKVKWSFGNDQVAYDALQVSHAFEYAGQYIVMLQADFPGCPNATTSIPVTVVSFPRVNLGPDTSICPGGNPIILSNRNFNSGSYQWSTGDTTATLTVIHEGEYWLRVSNGQCTATDTINISKACYLDIPNAFIPGNGSDAQAYFLPRQLLSKSVVTFDMKIFDRWGQLIFESDKTDGRGWDGNFKGKPMEMGVYVYRIKVSFADGITESYQGNITLIR